MDEHWDVISPFKLQQRSEHVTKKIADLFFNAFSLCYNVGLNKRLSVRWVFGPSVGGWIQDKSYRIRIRPSSKKKSRFYPKLVYHILAFFQYFMLKIVEKY